MAMIRDLQELNAAPRSVALGMLEPMLERSVWVAEGTVDLRPFASADELAQRLVDTILASSFEQRVALFRAHPELAGSEAAAGSMTEASTSEQGRLGLTSLEGEEAERLSSMNAAYSKLFGHPFILALHRVPDLETVFDVFQRRLAASPVEEHVSTLAEIASVISSRVSRTFGCASGDAIPPRSAETADG
ncbi:2-oxo-4-hydroxy-4-carboxy-5-ureidoimidazoline decarboxylase [Hoeflea sp.]|uniref:2-oxo-4-hydroxy-4-carboxy-5-ureidoimidazoline decarboxylase n=1 Tax=Hoeflea sp. TaxID=1940281 RepID=UPI003BB20502